MSIATEITRLQTAKADLKTAIEGKGVTVPSATKIDGYADLVESISGGGGTVEPEEKDVDFIDYDGTLLYSYTAAEFLAMTEMPPNPSHTGLVAQGWNWTLADAKEYVTEHGALVVGQHYTTDDGKTRIYITIEDNDPQLISPSVTITPNTKDGVTIDWGDGTTETSGSPGRRTIQHSYAVPGDYVINLEVTDGSMDLGHWGSNVGIFSSGASDYTNGIRIKKVEIGNGVGYLTRNSFRACFNLESVSVPKTIGFDNANGTMFDNCYNLKGFVVPAGVTTIRNWFSAPNMRRLSFPNTIDEVLGGINCFSLRKLTLPPVTSVPGNMISGSFSTSVIIIPGTYTSIPSTFVRQTAKLRKFTVPETVTSIADYAFTDGSGLEELHFKPTTPPTLANSRGLSGIPGTFYVPYSADHSILAAYQSATNWSTYASKMVEESA